MVAQLSLLASPWLGDVRFWTGFACSGCGPFPCILVPSAVSAVLLRPQSRVGCLTLNVSTPAWVRFSEPRPFLSRMREFLLGALTAGLTYAALWYQVVPGVDVDPAQTAPSRHMTSVRGREAIAPMAPESELRPINRAFRAEISAAEGGARSGGQQRWSEPDSRAPQTFLEPLPTALPKTIERMAELQRISADPNVLATRVQAMETDEADLAELKAFAERFVELPPDRVQRHVPGTSRSGTSPPGPAARRR